jgi:hypothetical protein
MNAHVAIESRKERAQLRTTEVHQEKGNQFAAACGIGSGATDRQVTHDASALVSSSTWDR